MLKVALPKAVPNQEVSALPLFNKVWQPSTTSKFKAQEWKMRKHLFIAMYSLILN